MYLNPEFKCKCKDESQCGFIALYLGIYFLCEICAIKKMHEFNILPVYSEINGEVFLAKSKDSNKYKTIKPKAVAKEKYPLYEETNRDLYLFKLEIDCVVVYHTTLHKLVYGCNARYMRKDWVSYAESSEESQIYLIFMAYKMVFDSSYRITPKEREYAYNFLDMYIKNTELEKTKVILINQMGDDYVYE